MRRIVSFLVCLVGAMPLLAQIPTPIPITGNLGAISGLGQPYAGVSIQLQNCASPVSITGYFGIVQQGYQIRASSAGLVTGTIWPNDLITCNGTTGTSQYSVVLMNSGTPSGTTQCYQVTSAQGIWNMNTQQPISCSSPPPNPQDAQYRNLNVTGCFSVDGSGCGGSSVGSPGVPSLSSQYNNGGSFGGTSELNAVGTATVQAAVTAAGATGSVKVASADTDTSVYQNPNSLSIDDKRQQTEDLARLTAFMTPWLNKLGAGAGGNMTQFATCIVAKSCTVVFYGNSLTVGGQNAYENSIAVEFENAMEARYGYIFTWYNLGIGGSSMGNIVPYSSAYNPQLPVCPTGAPNCSTVNNTTAPFSFYTDTSSCTGFPGGCHYFPPTSNLINTFGPPFSGEDRGPWSGATTTTGVGWLQAGINTNPDAVIFNFTMNDQAAEIPSVFTNLMVSAIAPFLGLTKVPSIVMIAGPNGSISTPGQATFTQTQYARLDEMTEDVRGLAEQGNWGLIDWARIFSGLRDSSDPVSTFYEQDTASFLNFSTNWELSNGSSGNATISGTGTGTSVVQAALTGTWQAVRKVAARDVIVAGVWNTTNAAAKPAIQWRVPTDLSTAGYQAYLTNHGDGSGSVAIYSSGGGNILNVAVPSGITNTTSFKVQAEGAKYYVWVNGKLIIGPNVPLAGEGFDYDYIGYGYAGVGAVTDSSFTSTINYVTIEPGSPLGSCATPLTNRQFPPPCAPAYASDQSLYALVTDYGSNLRSMGGNTINHLTILGTYATFGPAMVPLLDHIDTTVAQATVATGTIGNLSKFCGINTLCNTSVTEDGGVLDVPEPLYANNQFSVGSLFIATNWGSVTDGTGTVRFDSTGSNSTVPGSYSFSAETNINTLSRNYLILAPTAATFDEPVNATTGFQIGATAPLNHCLLGNGTNYVDSATCGSGGVSPGSGYAIPAYPSGTSSTVGPSNMTTDSTGNNLNVPGKVTIAGDGVHAGLAGIIGNTTNPTIPANNWGFIGPDVATFTSWFFQPTTTPPTAGQVMAFGAPVAGVSQQTWMSLPLSCQPGLGDGLNAITAGTYLQTTCKNETGQTWTLTAIRCVADSGSSTCAVTNGAGTSLLTGAITGTSTYANGAQSGTTTIASGDYLKVTFVADGTSKQIGIDVAGTY